MVVTKRYDKKKKATERRTGFLAHSLGGAAHHGREGIGRSEALLTWHPRQGAERDGCWGPLTLSFLFRAELQPMKLEGGSSHLK